MRILLLIMLIFGFSLAQERPKIALVLSGGGARGGAHVGVLKALEDKKIPIDIIVGTSIGSFIGGLYASGKSPEYIEKMLISTQWRKYIRTDFDRVDTPMRVKEVGYTYQGRLGLGINFDNRLVLPTGVLKKEPLLLKFMQETQETNNVTDFDKFPIKFRAVATNITDGEPVVIKSGSLAKAIYASSSIPGGFEPIKIDGLNLVDGGVSDNLPVQVAKDMGADIVIAVDVSENFKNNLDVNSYFVVLEQLVDILMRKNVNKSILKLSNKDILLTPNLDGFSGLDIDKYKEIIDKGFDITISSYETRLKHLSLNDEDYEVYREKHRLNTKATSPIIDAIEIQNHTNIADESILRRIKVKVGQRLDEEVLRENLLHLYNMTIFDSVEYKIKKIDGKNILVIITRPNWNNKADIRLALGIADDFQGHSSYSLKGGFTLFGLNKYWSEWKTDIELGEDRNFYSEFFQPLDSMQRYYVKPSVLYSDNINYLSYTGSTVELELTSYGAGIALGANIGTNYAIEIGIGSYRDTVDISSHSVEYESRPIYASVLVDTLDDFNFPNKGVKATLKWTKEVNDFGSDYDHEKLYFDIKKPLTLNNNNITTYLKMGTTFNNHNKSDSFMLSDKFILGGLFNMSGYKPYYLVGNNMFLAVAKYRYKLKDGGLFGSLNAPLYTGFSLEAGDAWYNGEHRNFQDLKKSASVYVAADTFLGPFYLAYSFSEEGKNSFYLYLGESF